MLEQAAGEHAVRSLSAGVLHMLLRGLGNHLLWRARCWVDSSVSPFAVRIRQWRGWAALGELLSLAFSVAFLFVMLLNGTFGAGDVGIGPCEWQEVAPWVIGIAAGASLCLSLLWGAFWRRRRAPGWVGAHVPNEGAWASLLIRALRHGAIAAIYRGALAPLVGSYWGVWLAAIWKMLSSRTDPRLGVQLRRPGQRELIYLDWALDWVGATLYIVSGSVWAALFGRTLGYAGVLLVAKRATGRRLIAQAAAPSSNDLGKEDEHAEHGGGQDGDALQIV